MIKNIKLKFGLSGQSESLSFPPGAVTVFVGPNNSGKSLCLKEIENYCSNGKQEHQKILDDIEYSLPTDEELKSNIQELKLDLNPEQPVPGGQIKYGKITATKGLMHFTINPDTLINWKNSDIQNFCAHYIKMFTARLGGKERFDLIKDVPNSDLKSHPNSILMSLFQSNEKRARVRELIYEAFQKYFVIDPTDMKHLKIRLSDNKPISDEIEKGWDGPSVEFHKNAKHILEFSDGVQAFIGILISILAGEELIILIDEPDSFLHPSLAFLLGQTLSEIMSGREGNLIVSTHSSHFLMGCIQSGKNLNIIRLTYDVNQHPTARILSSNRVSELFRNPMLRSIGILPALFYNSVIVTESNTDRAFYNEINERIIKDNPKQGILSCLFVNAQNKQTIWDIVKPLREMGIPTAAIVDIDVIKDGGNEFTKLLDSVSVPKGLHQSLSGLRADILKSFNNIDKDMKKDGGIQVLGADARITAQKLIGDLAEYGVFIVPNGELESWLGQLKVTGHASKWLIAIFEKMGSDASNENYLKPDENDVWEFIRNINHWVINDKRKGIPI